MVIRIRAEVFLLLSRRVTGGNAERDRQALRPAPGREHAAGRHTPSPRTRDGRGQGRPTGKKDEGQVCGRVCGHRKTRPGCPGTWQRLSRRIENRTPATCCRWDTSTPHGCEKVDDGSLRRQVREASTAPQEARAAAPRAGRRERRCLSGR